MSDEPKEPYSLKLNPPEHEHTYQYAVGRIAIRWCVECGQSWALMELQDMIGYGVEKYSFRWRLIESE